MSFRRCLSVFGTLLFTRRLLASPSLRSLSLCLISLTLLKVSNLMFGYSHAIGAEQVSNYCLRQSAVFASSHNFYYSFTFHLSSFNATAWSHSLMASPSNSSQVQRIALFHPFLQLTWDDSLALEHFSLVSVFCPFQRPLMNLTQSMTGKHAWDYYTAYTYAPSRIAIRILLIVFNDQFLFPSLLLPLTPIN